MSKKTLLPLAAVLIILCLGILIVFGQNYTAVLDNMRLSHTIDDESLVRVEITNDDPGAEIKSFEVRDKTVIINFSSVKKGKTDVSVYYGDETLSYIRIYTHTFGILTFETLFGDCTGDICIPLAMIVFFSALLYVIADKLRADVRKSIYQYRNVMNLGLIVYLSFFILNLARQCYNYHGVIDSVNDFLGTIHFFSVIVLPAAFVISILVTLSSISLMRREGRSWRNMLGVILGVGICLLTLLPTALGEYLQWSPNAFMDVHNEQGAGLYIENFTEGVISMIVSYLECILIGTVVFGIKSAKHIPEFNKDYILILGCKIRKDGSLPPLLRSRADRAVEFARMQKEKTGRDICFVPSGGQGPDEVMAEADAIRNYLISQGIPGDKILPENKSVNTYENIVNSIKIIEEHSGASGSSAAFSTTNYHVFRAGLIAEELGAHMEGIGSTTKQYFWINAFVREFIATLSSERKKHLIVIAVITLMIVLAVIIKYLSINS